MRRASARVRVDCDRVFWCVLAVLTGLSSERAPRAAVITTRGGMQFEGRVDRIGSLNENPLNPGRGAGEVPVKPIVIIDDDWRRTFIANLRVVSAAPSQAAGLERIRIQQRVATSGRRVGSVGRIIEISRFDEFGRRIFSMQGARRRIDVVQGITEITPTYTKVEGLLLEGNSYAWDMRIATSSIPRETLSRILLRQVGEEDVDSWLRIVRLYIQSERYHDALIELERVIEAFPDLPRLEEQAAALRQSFAQDLLREIELRRAAGQHQRVRALLNNFPTEGIAGETLLRVREMLNDYERQRGQYERVLESLEQHLSGLKDPATRAELDAARVEIREELNVYTLSRMADYLRLADDASLADEQKVALAISGWLLGSGSATENLAVAISLFETRDEIRRYLRAERPHERQESLERIRSREGGAPAYVAKLVAQMTPPIETQADPLDVPGFYELQTPGTKEQPEFSYFLQLPPEYDPHRRYPCVVTLNGSGTSETQQVDWWAGTYSERSAMRKGQASRRGYIVLAPRWRKPYQREYEYSSREHAAVLYCLRDACRRASIDTDRVFLSGHSMGGNAAWDIGVAHPDLWAGVIPIVARAEKYIKHYWENARGLPMYFVGGEKDGGWLQENGSEFDRYLKRAGFDTTVVQFRGRGHEHFQDEIQRIFNWMELAAHRRRFFPDEIETVAMRPWDNFFWWLELEGFPHETMVMPAAWTARGKRASSINAQIRDNQRISVRTGARQVTVWLSPEMISFDRRVVVSINGRDTRQEVAPDVSVLLEDVRTRADRQHPFWAKVEAAGRRR